MCGLPVDLDAEVGHCNLNKVHHTLQEGQTVISRILPGELDVLVHCVYVSSERLKFLCFNFDRVSFIYLNQ